MIKITIPVTHMFKFTQKRKFSTKIKKFLPENPYKYFLKKLKNNIKYLFLYKF